MPAMWKKKKWGIFYGHLRKTFSFEIQYACRCCDDDVTFVGELYTKNAIWLRWYGKFCWENKTIKDDITVDNFTIGVHLEDFDKLIDWVNPMERIVVCVLFCTFALASVGQSDPWSSWLRGTILLWWGTILLWWDQLTSRVRSVLKSIGQLGK